MTLNEEIFLFEILFTGGVTIKRRKQLNVTMLLSKEFLIA